MCSIEYFVEKAFVGPRSKFLSAVRPILGSFSMSPVDFSFFIYHFLLELRCVCDTSISLRKSRRAFVATLCIKRKSH